MRICLVGMSALALAGCSSVPTAPVETIQPAATTMAVGGDRVTPIIEAADFIGEVAYSGGADFEAYASGKGAVWPWASVTKQMMAIIVMQEVTAGRLSLDEPVSTYLRDWPEGGPVAPSLAQLLRHQSGLYDPEDDAAFDVAAALPLDPMMCVTRRAAPPGGPFDYNNCDTLLVGRVLERTTRHDVGRLFIERIAAPLGLTSSGFVTPDTPLPPSAEGTSAAMIAHYGAAGGLAGTAQDLLAIDAALMGERLLPASAKAIMWDGDPAIGYAALGQWAFEAPLAGCEGPVRIIERRGAIGGYQARNFILPERDFAMVAFTPRSEGDFAFGEIWTGQGFSHDLLSAAACGGR